METTQKRAKRASPWRSLRLLLASVIIFAFGVQVGNGRLDLGMNRGNASVATNLPANLNYSAVEQVYDSLKDNYDGKLNQGQLEDGLKHGLAQATKDPYTVYFTAKEASDFNSDLNQSFSGIGAQLGQDKDGNLEVIAPIEGFPAAKAGLKAKDLIASINGQTTAGESVDDAVNKIRGKAGTSVKLQVVRNKSQPLELTIKREDIKLPSVVTKTLDGNIGYIQITTFADDTSGLVQKAAQQFKQAGVKGVVLDMRNNPGGLLNAAVDVSSEWLDQGATILQEKRGGKTVVNDYKALGGDDLHDIKTVVLINGGSASASEITAGALHDNKAAYVIGEKSYGKGVVQQLINFKDGAQLKVTVASWYRPNGQNINHKGITPDQTVKASDADTTAGKDTQLEAAQTYLNK